MSQYEGSKEFEAQLPVRVQAGNPPDIAFVPQPGLLKTLVATPARSSRLPQTVSDNVDEFFGEDWKAYGTVDDKFYAAPLGANVKSFVWYSPTMFADNGWDDPRDVGRHARAVRHDRGDRHQAVVRRDRVR